jgi:hypothetical protein
LKREVIARTFAEVQRPLLIFIERKRKKVAKKEKENIPIKLERKKKAPPSAS